MAEPEPHYAAAIELTGAPSKDWLVDAGLGAATIARGDEAIDPSARGALAADAQRARRSGRLIRFPGHDDMRGTLPLVDVTGLTAIDCVVCLGAEPGPQAVLRTQDHVRPEYRDGSITLVIQPFDGRDEYVPFEQPNPHPCCGHH